jgi:hypothetical protein
MTVYGGGTPRSLLALKGTPRYCSSVSELGPSLSWEDPQLDIFGMMRSRRANCFRTKYRLHCYVRLSYSLFPKSCHNANFYFTNFGSPGFTSLVVEGFQGPQRSVWLFQLLACPSGAFFGAKWMSKEPKSLYLRAFLFLSMLGKR